MNVVEQYNETANDTNDNTKAFGTKIAMLRMFVDGCMDRITGLWKILALIHCPNQSRQRGTICQTKVSQRWWTQLMKFTLKGGNPSNPTEIVD